jgi:hypothetical protein
MEMYRNTHALYGIGPIIHERDYSITEAGKEFL